MTFKVWLKRNHYKDGGIVGALVRHIITDETFSKFDTEEKFLERYSVCRQHLEHQGATIDCIDTFNRLWQEYEIREREMRGMNLKNVTTEIMYYKNKFGKGFNERAFANYKRDLDNIRKAAL